MYIPLTSEQEKILSASYQRGLEYERQVREGQGMSLFLSLQAASREVFKGSKQMDADAYDALNALVDETALKTPSIPGMK